MEIRPLTALVVITVISRAHCASPGYSYSKFIGPVSGVEEKITVHDDGQYHQHDYVAKPDYHFEYGVEDPKSMVHQSRQETRKGDTVHDPDGKLRTVKYTADKKNGFHASITRDGHVEHHPGDPVKPIHEQQTPNVPQPPQTHNEDEYEGDDEGGNGENGGDGGNGGNDEGEYSESGGESEGDDDDDDDEEEEDEYY